MLMLLLGSPWYGPGFRSGTNFSSESHTVSRRTIGRGLSFRRPLGGCGTKFRHWLVSVGWFFARSWLVSTSVTAFKPPFIQTLGNDRTGTFLLRLLDSIHDFLLLGLQSIVPLRGDRMVVPPTALLPFTFQLHLKFLLREVHNILHVFTEIFPDSLFSWIVERDANKLVIPSLGGVIYHGPQSLLDPLP